MKKYKIKIKNKHNKRKTWQFFMNKNLYEKNIISIVFIITIL